MTPFKVQLGALRRTGDQEWAWDDSPALVVDILPDRQAVLIFEDGHIELRNVEQLTVERSEMARLGIGQ